MKRLVRIAMVALPLMTLAGSPAYAEVKTRDKTQVKFEGMLGRMFSLFGGKGAKEGIEGKTAVKGNRKATLTETGGTIVDLTEEKVYDIDAKKKQYTVTTFEELRRRMREARERAMKEAEKEEPGKKQRSRGIHVGRARAHSDQRVHVGRPVPECRPCTSIEVSGTVENDWCRENPLDPAGSAEIEQRYATV